MLKTLLSQVKEYKTASLLAPLFTALEVVMELFIPFITAAIIDQGIEAGDLGQVYRYGALMIVMAFLSLCFGTLAGRFSAKASAGFACNLRDAPLRQGADLLVFQHRQVQHRRAGHPYDHRCDQHAERLSDDPSHRRPGSADAGLLHVHVLFHQRPAERGLSGGAGGAGGVPHLHHDPDHPGLSEGIPQVRRPERQRSGERVRHPGGQGLRPGAYEDEKFKKAADGLYRLFVKAESTLALNSPIMMLVVYGSILALSWFGAHYIVAGELTTGNLTSLFSYVMGVLMSLMMLSMIFVMVTMSIASAERICEVLKETPALADPERPLMTVSDGRVDFDHVSFSYQHGSGEVVLRDIDLHIASGETIGVVGGTGSGKSSLVNLISRLYDVDQGSVRVGGVDVRDYDLEALRNQVAVVLQKNVLFSGTILDNLRWGKEDATEEECREAARLACADEFIDRFPDGYNTWIEQGGSNVSGGQKQRLCIARALLKSPKVLILDDSTSAVDTATDAKIREAFARQIPVTTKIIIAQRVSSVQNADRILVLDNGAVSGFDTHENLLKTNRIYQEIYEAQTQGGGDFDHPVADDGKDGAR